MRGIVLLLLKSLPHAKNKTIDFTLQKSESFSFPAFSVSFFIRLEMT